MILGWIATLLLAMPIILFHESCEGTKEINAQIKEQYSPKSNKTKYETKYPVPYIIKECDYDSRFWCNIMCHKRDNNPENIAIHRKKQEYEQYKAYMLKRYAELDAEGRPIRWGYFVGEGENKDNQKFVICENGEYIKYEKEPIDPIKSKYKDIYDIPYRNVKDGSILEYSRKYVHYDEEGIWGSFLAYYERDENGKMKAVRYERRGYGYM